MARRRRTPEQIICKLREADRLLAQAAEIADVAGMKADDVERLRELERENAALKRIVADKERDNLALRQIAKGNW